MSKTWNKVLELVASGDLRISEHGYEELAADRIAVRDIVSNVAHADVLEDYPDYPKGPCVLVLFRDDSGPVHAVWGVPKGRESPAVLITAYRPDPQSWSADFRMRKNR